MSAAELSHGPECSCVRCAGFQAGHSISVKHGAYAVLALHNRSAEIADALRGVVPSYSPADEPAVRLLAVVLTRVEKATAALDRVDEATEGRELGAYASESAQTLQRLREDCRGWVNSARRLANDLGMTPTSRAKLGLDIARTGDELRAYLDQRYPAADRGD